MACARWWRSTTAGCRPSRWHASWWRTGGSAPSGTCARSTCRTGSSTRPSRWSGGCRRTGPARVRSATSVRTSSTWRSSWSAPRSRGSPGSPRPSSGSGRCPRQTSGLAASGGTGTGEVTVDDAALFLARFDSGALGSFEATRFASGRKNALRLEVNGSAGSIAFDFEAMNELQFHDHTEDTETAGFRRILVTEPSHPYADAWWPPGHGLGYEHTFTHEVVDLVTRHRGGPGSGPVVRRRAPGAAGARRGREVGRARQRLGGHRRRRGAGPGCELSVTKQPGLAAL